MDQELVIMLQDIKDQIKEVKDALKNYEERENDRIDKYAESNEKLNTTIDRVTNLESKLNNRGEKALIWVLGTITILTNLPEIINAIINYGG